MIIRQMVNNPFLIFIEAMVQSYVGRYVIFLCIKDCEFGMNVNNSTPYSYNNGSLYGTVHTPWFPIQKNPIYTETFDGSLLGKGAYRGAVTAEFLEENFIPYDDYKTIDKTLSEKLDKVFGDE